jgi:hypothetical protein
LTCPESKARTGSEFQVNKDYTEWLRERPYLLLQGLVCLFQCLGQGVVRAWFGELSALRKWYKVVKDLQLRGMNGALLLGIQENLRFSPPSGVVGADPCEIGRFG